MTIGKTDDRYDQTLEIKISKRCPISFCVRKRSSVATGLTFMKRIGSGIRTVWMNENKSLSIAVPFPSDRQSMIDLLIREYHGVVVEKFTSRHSEAK